MYPDKLQDAETLRPKVEALSEQLEDEGSHNFIKNFPHTTKDGLIGYDLFFGGDYIFGRTWEAIRAHGLEPDSLSRKPGDFVERANITLRVRERDSEITPLLDD